MLNVFILLNFAQCSGLANFTYFSTHHLKALLEESELQPYFVLTIANTKVVTFKQ